MGRRRTYLIEGPNDQIELLDRQYNPGNRILIMDNGTAPTTSEGVRSVPISAVGELVISTIPKTR